MSLVGHQRPAWIRAQVHVVSIVHSNSVAVSVMFECFRADNVASSPLSSLTTSSTSTNTNTIAKNSLRTQVVYAVFLACRPALLATTSAKTDCARPSKSWGSTGARFWRWAEGGKRDEDIRGKLGR